MKSFNYPKKVTENFDHANFHITYCVNFLKKYLKRDILEVGAGCGIFTKIYYNKKINSITLTELDKNNLLILNKKYAKFKNFIVHNKKN